MKTITGWDDVDVIFRHKLDIQSDKSFLSFEEFSSMKMNDIVTWIFNTYKYFPPKGSYIEG